MKKLKKCLTNSKIKCRIVNVIINKVIKRKEIEMICYVLQQEGQLVHVRSYESGNPVKSKAEFTFALKDLPQIKAILSKGGKTDSYNYNFAFDGNILSIHYIWNGQIFKKIQISNLDNLLSVLSSAMDKKESPVKRWLKKWVLSKGKRP